MRKLALWHTRTFKPVMTHEELEPIMSTMGFVAQATGAGGGFKEYVFLSSPTTTTTRPRLPYPHIDGLHITTYQAFIDALTFFLDVSDLFHVRYTRGYMPTFSFTSRWIMNVDDAGECRCNVPKITTESGVAWKRTKMCLSIEMGRWISRLTVVPSNKSHHRIHMFSSTSNRYLISLFFPLRTSLSPSDFLPFQSNYRQ